MTSIGLVGCGNWGKHILRDLKTLGCQVSVVARSPESRGRAEAGGAARVVAYSDQLGGVEGVVIATPTFLHADSIEEVLDRGVPVFVEKPLTNDSARARAIANAAPDRVFVMDKWRYHPGIELLARLARNGDLGEIRGVKSVRFGWGISHSDVDAVWILFPHDLSIVLEILGHLPSPTGAVADVAGGLARGIEAWSMGSPWAAYQVSSRSPERIRSTVVYGETATALLSDGFAEHVAVYPTVDLTDVETPMPRLLPISNEMPLLAELRAFVEHVRGGPPPRSSAEEGATIVQAITSFRRLAGLDRNIEG
jgi:predicted dehydrogenase